jgi:hypothetical protein
MIDPRNANFEHYLPQCNNCRELFAPDDLDLETMLCAGCHHDKEEL